MGLINKSLQDFTGLLSSAAPTPGGGSSAAAEAALGVGLISKVALITMDKAGRYLHTDKFELYFSKSAGFYREKKCLVWWTDFLYTIA